MFGVAGVNDVYRLDLILFMVLDEVFYFPVLAANEIYGVAG